MRPSAIWSAREKPLLSAEGADAWNVNRMIAAENNWQSLTLQYLANRQQPAPGTVPTQAIVPV